MDIMVIQPSLLYHAQLFQHQIALLACRDAFIIGRPSGRVWLADTPDRCVRSLTALRAAKCVAIDCEGINLSRDGTVCIVQVVDAAAQDDVHLFDITRLGSGGLDIRPDSHRSLRQLLGDDSVEKLFWDVRADNDALFNLHDVRLANVIDLQACANGKPVLPIAMSVLASDALLDATACHDQKAPGAGWRNILGFMPNDGTASRPFVCVLTCIAGAALA